MKRILWTAKAQHDLAEIDAYWWAIDRDLAESLLARIEAAADFLREQPRIGRLVEEPARKWGVCGTPYLLLFRDASDRIEIPRIHHGREDWSGDF